MKLLNVYSIFPTLMQRVEGPNWLQRRLIQRERELREPRGAPQESGQPKEDPLAAVKRRYHQMYADDLGLDITALKTDPVHAHVLNELDSAVEAIVSQAENGYDARRSTLLSLKRPVPEDIPIQYLNQVSAATGRGNERILELLTHWQASGQPPESKFKRVVKKLTPFLKHSPTYEDQLKEVQISTNREVEEISNFYLAELKRRFSR